MKYNWKPGSRIKISVSETVERLEHIRKRSMVLTPELVVADAEPNNAVLHGEFEWNNKKAGTMYRLEQARHLIRSIIVIHDDKPAVRAFISIVIDEERSYTPIEVAVNDPALREQILLRAAAELESWRKRYTDLEEFAAVYSAIDRVAEAV